MDLLIVVSNDGTFFENIRSLADLNAALIERATNI